ncbi:MAG: hypothetical protein RBJ76_13180 [Stenomitos frigidus ULC029]
MSQPSPITTEILSQRAAWMKLGQYRPNRLTIGFEMLKVLVQELPQMPLYPGEQIFGLVIEEDSEDVWGLAVYCN